MDDPTDVNQLDLQSLPPEQAAALIRAHRQALAQQQTHALMGMLSALPEAQKAGEAEYGQAGRERAGTQELGGAVLKQTLEQTSQNRQLAALQQQIEYQRAQMRLEGQRLNMEMLRPFLGPLLESHVQLEKISGLASILGIADSKLTQIAKMPAESRLKAIGDVLGFGQQVKGGQAPKSPAPARVLPQTMGGSPPGPAKAAKPKPSVDDLMKKYNVGQP